MVMSCQQLQLIKSALIEAVASRRSLAANRARNSRFHRIPDATAYEAWRFSTSLDFRHGSYRNNPGRCWLGSGIDNRRLFRIAARTKQVRALARGLRAAG